MHCNHENTVHYRGPVDIIDESVNKKIDLTGAFLGNWPENSHRRGYNYMKFSMKREAFLALRKSITSGSKLISFRYQVKQTSSATSGH